MTEVYDVIESIKSEVFDKLAEELEGRKFKTEEEFSEACHEFDDSIESWGQDEISSCIEDEEDLIFDYGLQDALDVAYDEFSHRPDVSDIAFAIVEREWGNEDGESMIDDFVEEHWGDGTYEFGVEEEVLEEADKLVETALNILGKMEAGTRRYGFHSSILSALDDIEYCDDYDFSDEQMEKFSSWKGQIQRAYDRNGGESTPSNSTENTVVGGEN